MILNKKIYKVPNLIKVMLNKKGNWTLSAVLGVAGIIGIVLPMLSKEISKWFILLGIFFLVLAFAANKS